MLTKSNSKVYLPLNNKVNGQVGNPNKGLVIPSYCFYPNDPVFLDSFPNLILNQNFLYYGNYRDDTMYVFHRTASSIGQLKVTFYRINIHSFTLYDSLNISFTVQGGNGQAGPLGLFYFEGKYLINNVSSHSVYSVGGSLLSGTNTLNSSSYQNVFFVQTAQYVYFLPIPSSPPTTSVSLSRFSMINYLDSTINIPKLSNQNVFALSADKTWACLSFNTGVSKLINIGSNQTMDITSRTKFIHVVDSFVYYLTYYYDSFISENIIELRRKNVSNLTDVSYFNWPASAFENSYLFENKIYFSFVINKDVFFFDKLISNASPNELFVRSYFDLITSEAKLVDVILNSPSPRYFFGNNRNGYINFVWYANGCLNGKFTSGTGQIMLNVWD
jgi:hypothetical protein